MAANRLTDLLALSHVPRWSIVRHVSPQNVGDHTFRVMVIYTELMNRLNLIISTYALQTILDQMPFVGAMPVEVQDAARTVVEMIVAALVVAVPVYLVPNRETRRDWTIPR